MPVHTALVLPLAFFGGGDDDDEGEDDVVAAMASLLDTDPSAPAVERELEALRDAINATYGSVKDRLDDRQRVPVDAPPRRKAEAVERAVRRPAGGQSRDSGSDDGDAAATVREAAAAVREAETPESALARRLLDRVADERSSSRQLADAFEAAARQLDDHERAQSALDGLDRGAGVDSVPELADAYEDARRERHASASDRDRLSDAVESLLDELDADPDGGTLEQRVRAATRAVRTDSGGRSGAGSNDQSGADGGALADAVARAREDASPRSRRARRLFDALEEGRSVEPELVATAGRLDEAATTEALLEDVDNGDVADLADEVADSFAATDGGGAVADALRERAVDLGERVARADDSNRVVAFAAHEELSFYRESLLGDALGVDGGPAGAGSDAAVEDRLEDVRERRAAFERTYVEERSDHNHSIPLYFLSLVDEAVEDAGDDLAAGRTDRAAGTAAVAERLLDHVEGLYEQNQYSVMLRSLRG